jgi:hypothetical protein
MTITRVRVMGITHSDFFRRLPAALEGRASTVAGNRATVVDGTRGIEIELGPQGTRAIGLFRLPVTEVTFSFTGYDEAQADALLARIDLHYHRGGG